MSQVQESSGSRVLVLGASGRLGTVVVRSLLAQGREVIAAARRPERLEPLTELPLYGGALRTVAFDIADVQGALLSLDDDRGRIDAVVTTIGHWTVHGPLTALSSSRWAQLVEDNLTSHLYALQLGLSAMQGRGIYVSFNGEAAQLPMPGSGAISTTGAAQSMLLDVARLELAPSTQVIEIRLIGSLSGDERNITPKQVVDFDEVSLALGSALSGLTTDRLNVLGGGYRSE